MKTTLAVDVRNTVGEKGAKAASARSWAVGGHPIRDHAERIVAHDAGTKLMEFVSKSGRFINSHVENGKRIFDVDDMVKATKAEVPRQHDTVGRDGSQFAGPLARLMPQPD